MNSEFYEALTLLEKEKDIKKEYMLEKITAAIIAAVKKEKNMAIRHHGIREQHGSQRGRRHLPRRHGNLRE